MSRILTAKFQKLDDAARQDIEAKIKVLSGKVQDKVKEEKERQIRERYKLIRFLGTSLSGFPFYNY